MKHLPILIGAALVATIIVLFEAPWDARAEPAPPAPVASYAPIVPLPSAQPVPDVEVKAASVSPAAIAELVQRKPERDWLFAAAATWTALPPDSDRAVFERSHREPSEAFEYRLRDVIGAVTASKEAGSSRTALDLIAIAFMESGFQRYVDDGSCNTSLGYLLPRGRWDCDSGKAFTVWQFRPDTWWVRPGEDSITGGDLLADRHLAADKAWEKYHANPAGWSTWARAKALAERWAAAHPAPSAH